MPNLRITLCSALLGALTMGCTDSLTESSPQIANPETLPIAEQGAGPGTTVLRVATIEFYQDPIAIDVPATAAVGQPVELRVTTYSGGCIGDDTISVVQTDVHTDVVPYQKVYTPRSNEACTAELRITRRAVSLVFRKAGEVTVTVTGRRQPDGELLRITRTVRVN